MATNAHPPGADVVRLVGLGGIGRHGVLPEERRDGQTFLVDLDIHLDTRAAAAGDDLQATVDYGSVATQVVALIEGEPVNLLETLAARVADAVLTHDLVQAVDVTVHKPDAPLGLPFSDVQVSISRSAGDPPSAPPVAEPSAAPAPAPQQEAEAAPEQDAAPVPDAVPAAAAAPAVAGPAVAGAAAGVVPTGPGTPNEGVPMPSPAESENNGNDVLEREPDAAVAVVLGLGGNVGDVRSTLRAVVDDLGSAPGLQVQQVSPLARTAAVVPADEAPQPDFLNAVVLVTTTLSPNRLLAFVQSLETSYGRVRTTRWGQRTVDIDIIDYDGVSSTEDHLTLPHPRANERAFVLVPWEQADPDAFLPGVGGGPVAALAETAPDRGGVRWLALDWMERIGHGTDSGSFVVSPDLQPAPVGRASDAVAQEEAPAIVPPAGEGMLEGADDGAAQASQDVAPGEGVPEAADDDAAPASQDAAPGEDAPEAADDDAAQVGEAVPDGDAGQADRAVGRHAAAAPESVSGDGAQDPPAQAVGAPVDDVPSDPAEDDAAQEISEPSGASDGSAEPEDADLSPVPSAPETPHQPMPEQTPYAAPVPDPEPVSEDAPGAEESTAAEDSPVTQDPPAAEVPSGPGDAAPEQPPASEQTGKPFAPRWQPVQRRDEES